MYQAAGIPAVTGGALALTGANSLWLTLAGFALLSAGIAVMRIVPRHQE